MSRHGRRHLPRSHVFPLLCLLHIFTAAQGYADNNKYVNSTTCQGRCALFVHPSLKPKCQCDGLCGINPVKMDCCKDYEKICTKETVPKESSDLVVWVASIVGCVFVVVIVLAVVYFCLIKKKDIRQMSLVGVGSAHRRVSGARSIKQINSEPPAM
ncbi:hypothetical protein V1264_019187 [Littorina saxatilis]|uniref:SMB domain-containing protein n=1 Tax=Littorina saxatilis TaxID=31220 RepID=A0AAN9GCZ9_9CAEN